MKGLKLFIGILIALICGLPFWIAYEVDPITSQFLLAGQVEKAYLLCALPAILIALAILGIRWRYKVMQRREGN